MLGDSYFLVIRETLIYLIKLIYSGLLNQTEDRMSLLDIFSNYIFVSNMFGYHKKVKSRDKFDMPVKESLVAILTEVQALLTHDNDGIRTQSVRAIESFCALPNECRPLVESAKESIKNFLKEPHITSGNIVTGLMSLSRLAKSDNSYLSFMVTQYESIHSNLPPTLSVTQVQNVRKIVKIQLLDILRTVPGAQPFHSNIYQASFQNDISSPAFDLPIFLDIIRKLVQLLSDFNVSKKEFEAAIQAASKDKNESKSEKRKRPKDSRKDDDDKPSSKRAKSGNEPKSENDRIDELSKQLQPQLTIDNVIELVIRSMNMLPERMPASFSATYTPIESAGTEPQKEHLARMLASQMVAAGSVTSIGNRQGKTGTDGKKTGEQEKQLYSKQKKDRQRKERIKESQAVAVQQSRNEVEKKKEFKEFNLAKMTKPIKNKLEMARFAAEHLAQGTKRNQIQATRHLMLTRIVSQYGGSLSNIVADIIDQSRSSR